MFFKRKLIDSRLSNITRFLKDILGIRPNNIELYSTALIHRSASDYGLNGHFVNNERLEYLGDAVLDAIVAEYLFKRFPLKPEGELTEMRSKLVCRERLGALSRKLHMEDLITMDPHAKSKFAGGDAFEALVGAIFLDKGYKRTRKIVLKNLFSNYLNLDEVLFEESNFKSKIINWAQRKHKTLAFTHEVVEQQRGRKLYRVKLLLNDKVTAEGLDYTVKKAEQIAAERACEILAPKSED